jgi:muramoyltetrapeptide carboxypeptidase
MPPAPILPPAAREGDLVAVVAPAFKVIPAKLDKGLARLAGRLRLRVSDDIHRGHEYLAGPDERRADELDAAIRDPDVRAILLARGGYGIARILPLLDPAALRADPKPIVGFSDATALLSWAAHAGVCGIHGPVVSQLPDLADADVDRLVAAIRDPAPPGRLPWRLAPVGAPLAAPVAGPLVGGNLTLLANLIGTPWQVDVHGAIVLLEEIGEKPYAVDRDLTHLIQARALDGASGALVGDLIDCGDDGAGLAVVGERLGHAGLPGLGGAHVGHGARNYALPWGARTVLHPDGAVEVLGGAVV